ncbi:MAG: GTPase HflX [Nocardioidaceae bacterium]
MTAPDFEHIDAADLPSASPADSAHPDSADIVLSGEPFIQDREDTGPHIPGVHDGAGTPSDVSESVGSNERDDADTDDRADDDRADESEEGADGEDAFGQGDFELEERNALRRVAGLSTELQDVSEVEYRKLRLERVVLVGVWTEGTVEDADNSLAELKLLAETAGSLVLDALSQRRQKPDPATYIGPGKVDHVRLVVAETGADTVVCDGELSPSQLRNLEDRVTVKVVDRTALILDIFAQHARSKEGKAQVELAQLEYLKQRLRGWGGNLSRQAGGRVGVQGGGIGGRGPGETKLETDRRRITTRMAKLRRELKHMETARVTKKAERVRREIPAVVIAGYTNAGKSSLLNRLTNAGVLVEDALFATLDPKTRRTTTSDGRIYTLSDTVGFVRHLPHQLVEAFRSTLEEVAQADLVVHVVDGSHADPEGQIAAVREVLSEIGADRVPELIVINKSDVAEPMVISRLLAREPHAVVVSAATGAGVEDVLAAVEADLPRPSVQVDALVPYSRGDLLNKVHENGEVLSIEHVAEGTRLRALVNPGLAGEMQQFATTSTAP